MTESCKGDQQLRTDPIRGDLELTEETSAHARGESQPASLEVTTEAMDTEARRRKNKEALWKSFGRHAQYKEAFRPFGLNLEHTSSISWTSRHVVLTHSPLRTTRSSWLRTRTVRQLALTVLVLLGLCSSEASHTALPEGPQKCAGARPGGH